MWVKLVRKKERKKKTKNIFWQDTILYTDERGSSYVEIVHDFIMCISQSLVKLS